MKRFFLIAVLAFSALSISHNAKADKTKELDMPKISVQLWSVREDLAKDFRGTVTALADMGFEGLEFAGEFGEFSDDPEGLRAYLKSLGMVASGAHVGFGQLEDEAGANKVLDFYQKLGVPMLIVGWDDRAFSLDTVGKTIADINRLSRLSEAVGIKFGYHNHAEEFALIDGTTPWDQIAQQTPDSTVMQLDVSWATVAGQSAADYVRKYPGRTIATHFKAAVMANDSMSLPIIGLDSIDWFELIKAVDEVGGTQWIVLEQEEYPEGWTALQTVRASKFTLDSLLFRYFN